MISSGGAFPKTNINPGHIHFLTIGGDLGGIAGGQYVYLGGVASLSENWRLMGGNLNANPDTSGWGPDEAGAFWFNSSIGQFVGWNGSMIVVLG